MTRLRPVVALAAVVTCLAVLSAPVRASENGFQALGGAYAPTVPVSAFSAPMQWFDPSRLHVTTTVAMGTGFTGGAAGLQTTSFDYRFKAPVAMRVSLGNAFGNGSFSSAKGFFLQGLDLAWQPSASTVFQVRFQNVRSPLQFSSDATVRPYWGY